MRALLLRVRRGRARGVAGERVGRGIAVRNRGHYADTAPVVDRLDGRCRNNARGLLGLLQLLLVHTAVFIST
jgi:hypothetical protein